MNSKKKNNELIVSYEEEEQGMQEAITLAQQSFPEFEAEVALESSRMFSEMEVCLIKYAFPAREGSGTKVEHLFLSDIYHNGVNIIGILASEPMYTDDIVEGDEVVVDRSRVTDWLYGIDGKTRGGFTLKYMWQCFSEEEKNMYREEPPFSWLDLD